MPDPILPTTAHETVQSGQDAALDVLDQAGNREWDTYRQAHNLYDNANGVVDALDWAERANQAGESGDLNAIYRRLEFSGELAQLLDNLGWIADTPAIQALQEMLENISQMIRQGWDNLNGPGDGPGDGPEDGRGPNPNGPGGSGWAGGPNGPNNQFGDPDPENGPYGPDDRFTHPYRDPLILDLDGDGIELVSVTNSTANFDLDGDGFLERVGWATGGDGFLVIDLNADGQIGTLEELFGHEYRNSLDVLGDYNSNSDSVIDSNDAVFNQLRVWVDANSNGNTDAGELLTLAQAGVQSISLTAPVYNANVGGNVIIRDGSYTDTNNVIRDAGAVEFSINQLISQYILPTNFVFSELSLGLPEMTGFGNVANLRVAMTQDADLATLVKDLVIASGTLSYDELRAGIEELVIAWAGATDVVPGSRHQYIDAGHLAVIEAFYGQGYIFAAGGTVLTYPASPEMGQDLENLFDRIISYYGAMFVAQAGYADAANNPDGEAALSNPLWVFASNNYDGTLDTAMASLEQVVSRMAAVYQASPAGEGFAELTQILPWLKVSEYFGFAGDGAAFATALGTIMNQYFTDEPLHRVFVELLSGSNLVDLQTDAVVGDTTTGDDLINLAAGASSVSGGQGDDVYIYRYGEGAIAIDDNGTASPNDTVVFEGMFAHRATFTRGANLDDLIVSFQTSPADVLTISGQFGSLGWSEIENFVFSDGTTVTANDVRLMILDQSSTDQDDTINGFFGADIITGLEGNDLLIGGRGNDTYVYRTGDGHDTIRDGGIVSVDNVRLQGYDFSDATFSRSTSDATDLLITLTDGGTILVDGQFDGLAWDLIESFVFDDLTLTYPQVVTTLIDQAGTSGNDTIVGFAEADVIIGRGGDDLLIGARGDDTYIYRPGNGHDVIQDGGIVSTDTLRFDGFILSEATFSRATNDTNDLIVTLSDGGTVRVDQQFDNYGWDLIENFQFDDITLTYAQVMTALVDQAGTAANDTILGFAGADTIIGRGGDDILIGARGDDTYIYRSGDGHDVVQDGGISSNDTVRFDGFDLADAAFSRASSDQNDLIVTFSDGGSVRIDQQFDNYGWDLVEAFVFADQTVTYAQVAAAVLDQAGTSGSDIITGFSGADIIVGRGGDDSLIGAGGNDTYIYRPGDGHDTVQDGGIVSTDTIDFDGFNVADATFSRATDDQHDLIVTLADGGTVRVEQQFDNYGWDLIESFTFDDASLTYADVLTLVDNSSSAGMAGSPEGAASIAEDTTGTIGFGQESVTQFGAADFGADDSSTFIADLMKDDVIFHQPHDPWFV